MKVLYLSKASIVPAYQDKLRALAAHVDVHAVIPARWGRARAGPGSAGAARITTARALFHGHNHFHVYPAARAIVRSVMPDIAHLDEEPYSAVTYQFARICRRLRIPFVFFAAQTLNKPIPWPFHAMRRSVLDTAAAAIGGTERAAEALRKAGARREIVVIPQLGVDPDRFCPDPASRAAARAQLGLRGDELVVSFAGRLVPEKGVDVLLAAAALLDDVHVLVLGDGPERARLEQYAARHGLASRTRFVGHVESLDMPFWLNACDALVLPSRTTRHSAEQFGRVLVEAMACGVPVVGAESGEIPLVIGHAGLIFVEDDVTMLADRLGTLLGSVSLRGHLRELGRTRVLEHFTNDRIALATAALYERLLARVHSRGSVRLRAVT